MFGNRDQSPLSQIVSELEKATPIDRALVLNWMRTDDIEALGALMSLLAEGKHLQRVQPPLAPADYYGFVAEYYKRCISENPDGEWSDSRTTAGWDFAKWFIQLWDDESVSRDVMLSLKHILETLCKERGTEMCIALVTAVMEHLFQRPDVEAYFADWKEDPMLRSVYDEASHLAQLTTRRKSHR